MTNSTLANQYQIQRYFNLCAEKGQKIDPQFKVWDSEQIEVKIRELRIFKPISEKQIDLITELQDRLLDAEIISSPIITNESLKKLSTMDAFDIVKVLQDELNSNQHKMPPTARQIGELTKMFYFPSARFEDFGISVYKKIDMGNGQFAKSFYTVHEIYKLIEQNMSAEDATHFLHLYSPEFDHWTNHQKATPNQIMFIRTLENRMYNFSSPRRKEISVDMEGNMSEVPTNARAYLDRWITNSQYPGLSEIEINLLDRDQATKYIQQLNGEISYKRDMYKCSEFEKECTRNAEWDSFERNERTREERERKELNDFFYAFQAHIGMEIEELMNHAGDALIENPNERSVINPFVRWALWAVVNEFSTFGSLKQLASRSPQGKRLVKIAKDTYTKRVGV